MTKRRLSKIQKIKIKIRKLENKIKKTQQMIDKKIIENIKKEKDGYVFNQETNSWNLITSL